MWLHVQLCVVKSYTLKLLKTIPSWKPAFLNPCPISPPEGYRYQENLYRNMLRFSSKFLDTYGAGKINLQLFHDPIRRIKPNWWKSFFSECVKHVRSQNQIVLNLGIKADFSAYFIFNVLSPNFFHSCLTLVYLDVTVAKQTWSLKENFDKYL